MKTGERKLKAEMKSLRQEISRVSNKNYQRTQKKKATAAKGKELLNEFKKLMDRTYPTTRMLKKYKGSWIDKLGTKRLNFRNSLRGANE